MQYKFVSPLFVELPRKTKANKKVYLNLNAYRNMHFIVNNLAKSIYTEMMKKQMEGIKFKTKVEITFTLFKGRNGKIDRSNVLSIVEKFFCDALKSNGCYLDDNDDFISATHYYSGGYEKDKGRVDIVVVEV